MEDRLPPGDMLLGSLLAGTWLAPGVGLPTADYGHAFRLQAETSMSQEASAQPRQLIASPDPSMPNSYFFAANTSIAQQEPTRVPTGSAQAVSHGNDPLQPTYRQLSGLDDDVLDQLLAEDGDPFASGPSMHPAGKEENIGRNAGADPAAAPATAGSASSSALGQSPQSVGMPLLANEGSGGLVGCGGAAAPQASTISASATPNLLTEGHFLNGTVGNTGSSARVSTTPIGPLGSHGTITPYTSCLVWPSDTPPASGGSGGSGPPVDTVNSSSGGSNSGATGGINNSNNGSSRGSNSGGSNSGGSKSAGASSGGTTSNATGDFMLENAASVADHSLVASSASSPAGVRYFDGQISVSSTDLSTDGFGGL